MKASKSMRIWFALVGTILWTGIYLTGFSNVNWLLYVPAAGFIFAAITGLCLSLTAISKMFGFDTKAAAN
ncbi:MAG: hypothetical protein ABI861_02955 [Panacibacter sp.]